MATYVVVRHEKGNESVVGKADGKFYTTQSLALAKDHAVLLKSTCPENEYSISKLTRFSDWKASVDSRYTIRRDS